ncbi:prolyl oligopeptidase family serine peptidase, partial [Candidatus Neomarinimicrobiota bacterium]
FEDGSFIRTSERSGYNHIYHFDRDGNMLGAVTSGEWEVSNLIAVDLISTKVFFTGKHESVIESHFYSINLDGSDFKRLTDQTGWHRINMNPDASIYIDSFSNTRRPLAISGFLSSGEMLREISITDISQYHEYSWSYPENFQIETSDNRTKLNAMITYPRDFNPDKKYPVLIYGYSGPASQVVGNFWDRRGWHQFMSQQGYIIFSVDHRGTGGRGTAFKHLAYKDIGKWMVNDQIEGVSYLKSLPFVDENRIGVWGWSGGGYLTAMCMTKGAPHFNVGIAVAPVTDFRWYDTIWTERYMGLLSDNESGYESASAISYIDQLEGKLLLIHGTGDDNVHSQNSFRMVQEAVTARKQIDMFFYPNKNHGIRGPKTTYHLYSKMTNYILENL